MAAYYLPFIFIFIVLLLSREIFTYKKILMFKYLLTPLITFCAIVNALLSLRINNQDPYIFIILIGLIFSLVGDVILMIEEKRFLIHGLIFFLFAQITYIFALSKGYHFQTWNIIIAIPLIGCIAILYNVIQKKFPATVKSVLIYMIAISAMTFFAISQFNNGNILKAYLLTIGALLFVISDIVLAINEFVRHIPNSSVIVWSIYAPAQFLIGVSCYYS